MVSKALENAPGRLGPEYAHNKENHQDRRNPEFDDTWPNRAQENQRARATFIVVHDRKFKTVCHEFNLRETEYNVPDQLHAEPVIKCRFKSGTTLIISHTVFESEVYAGTHTLSLSELIRIHSNAARNQQFRRSFCRGKAKSPRWATGGGDTRLAIRRNWQKTEEATGSCCNTLR
jgi:hypothetical protein